MKEFFRHAMGQPFVFATGLAALVHSTWALGTLFSGQQPEGWHLLGWLIPALLIAFALDVGQIATSSEIREHGLTIGRGVTFFVFAMATYYLQWLYIAHHMPALEIAAGVSATAKATAVYMRDAALWIIPGFLPLATVLYTFSGKHAPVTQKVDEPAPIEISPVLPTEPLPMYEPLPQLEEGEAIPFGSEAPALVALESIQVTPTNNGHTASANGTKPKAKRGGSSALRNKGIEGGE